VPWKKGPPSSGADGVVSFVMDTPSEEDSRL
jgi:hypothetical protein